jgi:hypothetical protein
VDGEFFLHADSRIEDEGVIPAHLHLLVGRQGRQGKGGYGFLLPQT